MLPELKQKLDQQYAEMYPATDWKEIIGSVVVVALLGAFGYLWFSVAPFLFQ